MSDPYTKRLEQVKELLKQPLPPAEQEELDMPTDVESTEAPKKAAKKAAKKKVPAKKAAAKPKAEKAPSNLVNLAALAEKAKISTQRARQKLREAEIERDGRWSWEKGSRALAQAEKALGL